MFVCEKYIKGSLVHYLFVFGYFNVKFLVELVLVLAICGLIEVDVILKYVFGPAAVYGQALPHWIRNDLTFDELLPQHALGDDTQPFATHQLGRAQGFGVQVRKYDFGDGEQTFGYFFFKQQTKR